MKWIYGEKIRVNDRHDVCMIYYVIPLGHLPPGSNPYGGKQSLVGRDSQQKITSEGVKHTIKVGALGIDGRDLRDGHIDGGFQGRLMRHLFEALQRSQQPQGELLRDSRSYLHRVDPLFTFTFGD